MIGHSVQIPPTWTPGRIIPPDLWKLKFASEQSISVTPTATRSAMGASLSDTAKWYSGVLAPNGKIYGIPYSSTDILQVSVSARGLSLSLCSDQRTNRL